MLSCCVLHEMNRQNLVKNGLLDKLDAVFVGNEIQGNVQLTSFYFRLRVLLMIYKIETEIIIDCF